MRLTGRAVRRATIAAHASSPLCPRNRSGAAGFKCETRFTFGRANPARTLPFDSGPDLAGAARQLAAILKDALEVGNPALIDLVGRVDSLLAHVCRGGSAASWRYRARPV